MRRSHAEDLRFGDNSPKPEATVPRHASLLRTALGLLAAASLLPGCEQADARQAGAAPPAAVSAAPSAATRAEPSAAAASAARAPEAPPQAPGDAAPSASPPPSSDALPRPEHAPPSRSTAPGERIHAKARFVWIQPAPQPSKGWLGYLTLGGSVRLFEGSAEKAKTYGPGCDAWYRVEPMGYVCLGAETTLDENDAELVRLRAHAAKIDEPYPYDYAESIGAPRYVGLPSPKQVEKAEWDYAAHQKRLSLLREGRIAEAGKLTAELYAGVDASPFGRPPPAELGDLGQRVREARDYVAPGSTIAYASAFDADERSWLYTSDHVVVPKDRTKPYARIAFHGVRLGDGVELPLGFARKSDAPLYRRTEAGFEEAGSALPRLAHVALTGERARHGKETMLESRDRGLWLRERDLAVAEKAERIPFREGELEGELRTWVDVRILGGTLVAYEGDTPVYATLNSSGRGGLPVPGRELISTASTPTGTFRVDGKFRTATMVSSTDSSVVHSEVQFVQNFHGPHALHGAYWHDRWGELKSGGCVNLSPIDSKWLFEWSEPRLPPDWHGMRSAKELGPPTRVVVRP